MSFRLEAALSELAAAIRAEVAAELANGHAQPDRLLSIPEAALWPGSGANGYARVASGVLPSETRVLMLTTSF